MTKSYKNMVKNCPSCNRNLILPYQYEYICLFYGHNIIKQKHELTKEQRKRQTFSSRLKYAERKIWTICVDVMQTYSGDDYDELVNVLSSLKKIKK